MFSACFIFTLCYPQPDGCAYWDKISEKSGITYENGKNKGFIELNVTVTEKTQSTGTEDILDIDLKIYPNPFTDVVHIMDADVAAFHVVSLKVINTAGMIVHSQMITRPDETVRLEHLPSGVYFFLLEKDGKSTTVKVVKE